MEYIVKILRTLFFHIDRVVYEGIGSVYDLLLRIARTTILSDDMIGDFSERIYALIGIFMLFKISISLITYVLNPDEFVDKEKGFSSIIKRVVISLFCLALVPYGFKELFSLQTILLEDNTLAAIFFGDIDDSAYKIDTAGDKIKFILMYTFFQPNYQGLYENEGNTKLASCAITYEFEEVSGSSQGRVKKNDDGAFMLNQECFGTYNADSHEYVPSTPDTSALNSDSDYGSYWDDKDLYQTYAQGVARQNFYLMFRHNIAMAERGKDKGLYLVDYMAPLSTAVGVAVLWVLILFCIDVAVRSVKLSFYQLIAPIPILSYVDPKSKDGMFTKWLKQVGTTFLSLFMRLIALYLAIYLISEVSESGIRDVITGERVTDWWVQIFVIIGVLMFAKQLPKILEDTLGIKGTGDFTLNPLKKLESIPGGKMLSAPVKAVGNLGKGIARGATLGVGAAAGVGIAGLVTGQGLRGGAMGKALLGAARGEKFGKNFATSYGAGRARKKELDQMKADGVSASQVRGEKFYNAFHGETKAEHVQHAVDTAKAIQSRYESYEKTAVGVDSYAKYADKQAKAAAARGDFEWQRTWEDIRDDRIKEIHTKNGEISTSKNVSDSSFFVTDAHGTVDYSRRLDKTGVEEGTTQVNAALANLAHSMTQLATQFNEQYSTVAGYSKIDGTKDPKGMKNEALGAQQSIETNSANTTINDVAKYTGGSKK